MKRLPLLILFAVLLLGTVFSCSAHAVVLPVEVTMKLHPTQMVNLTLPMGAASQAVALQLRVQGLEYEGQAGVKIGNAPMLTLTRATAPAVGMGSEWGGIGGPINVMTLRLSVAQGVLVDGVNPLTFNYLKTDGVNSEYRVIGIAVLDAAGNNLLPASQVRWEDPAKWGLPLIGPNNGPATADDVQQGWLTFTTTSLITSPLNATRLNVRCADCHTSDGRDLSYFNYSTPSIVARAMFHGLTQHQGQQIAAYIRSLPYRSQNGRPWNPPYQPGPGLDSRPASEWAAGAGIDAVLVTDQAVVPYLFPNGINAAAVSTFDSLNMRELPENYILPTWNQWLPSVHPLDAPWGARFSTDPLLADYEALQQKLKIASADPATLNAFVTSQKTGGLRLALQNWVFNDWLDFDRFLRSNYLMLPSVTPAVDEAAYSSARWRLVKEWELMQTYGLEGMAPAFYNARNDASVVPSRLVEARSWFTPDAFDTSPHAIGINMGQDALTLGGSLKYASYFLEAWYHLQLILNPGNGRIITTGPFDYPYGLSTPPHRSDWTGLPVEGWQMCVVTKGAQESQNGYPLGPNGYDPNVIFDLRVLIPKLSGISTHVWDGYDPTTRAQLLDAFYGSWLEGTMAHTLTEYQAAGYATPSTLIDTRVQPGGGMDTNFGGRVYQSLQNGAAYGVDPALLTSMNAWAVQAWPASAPTFQNLMNSLGLGISITPTLGSAQ